VSRSEGLLGAALVLSAAGDESPGMRLRATLTDGATPVANGALARRGAGNAMAPMLPLFDALATGGDLVVLDAGAGRVLRVELAHG
jgi:hypothetical protein